MPITWLIFDTVIQATKSKETFGNNYIMYCNYLAQFNYNNNRIVPIAEPVYQSIEVSS